MTEEPQHGALDDLWSWIDQEDSVFDVPAVPPSDVTAVMVVTDAAEWLPRQLHALERLDPRPGTIIAVDAASTDDSLALLQAAHEDGVLTRVVEAGERVAFGAAVELALTDTEPEWLWLLHDDSAPHQGALGELLEGARRADVVVPKLLQPKRRNYPETLAEAGQTITGGGLRVPLVEVGDIDQGQLESTEVLGASTAGLLIRGEVWREVGGLAPELPRHRDGVEFGWRVNGHGYRVLTWPEAALNHLEAGRTGLRPHDEHPHVADRVAALRIAAARGARRGTLGVASVLRAAGFLIAKSPGHAAAELRALRRYGADPALLDALRARIPEEDVTPPELLPQRLWPLRHALDRFGGGVAERYRDLADSPPAASIDELTGDDFAGGVTERRRVPAPAILFGVLIVAALVAGRTLLGLGPVSGGGLLPAPGSFGAAWNAYLTGDAPWLGFASIASLAGLGFPGWFAFLALLTTPLLAAGAVLSLMRLLDVPGVPAAVISACWGGGVILLGLVTAGDATGMTLAVVGPLLARSVIRIASSDATGAERLRLPAGAALWLTIASAVWPAALLFATLLGGWALLRHRGRVAEVLVALLPAWAFLAPWLPTLARHPGRLLTGVDPLAWPEIPPASYALLIGRILPSGLPLWANVAFFAIIGVVAAVAIGRLHGWRMWVAVSLVAGPLLLGTVLSRLTVGLDGGVARPLLSPWALLALAAMLAPVAWQAGRRPAGTRWAQIALGAAAAVAIGSWAVVGFAGPVESRTSELPGYVRDVVVSERDSRVLLVDLGSDGTVSWNIVDSRRPQWGSGETDPAGGFSEQFSGIATSLATDAPPADLAERLRLLGVSHLWLRGFEPQQRSTVDNLEGLLSAPTGGAATVWTVTDSPARAFLVGVDGSYLPIVDNVVPDGAADRTLWLAEEPGASWTASVDGRTLDVTSGPPSAEYDLQLIGFTLGADGGELELEPVTHDWRFGWHLLIGLGLIVLAAPSLGGAGGARRGAN